jgi:hypothetical protein
VRILARPGTLKITGDTIVSDSGRPDPVDLAAEQHAVAYRPPETLVYLLGSRYCDVDLMTDRAWALFSGTPFGWGRVQAIYHFGAPTNFSAVIGFLWPHWHAAPRVQPPTRADAIGSATMTSPARHALPSQSPRRCMAHSIRVRIRRFAGLSAGRLHAAPKARTAESSPPASVPSSAWSFKGKAAQRGGLSIRVGKGYRYNSRSLRTCSGV